MVDAVVVVLGVVVCCALAVAHCCSTTSSTERPSCCRWCTIVPQPPFLIGAELYEIQRVFTDAGTMVTQGEEAASRK